MVQKIICLDCETPLIKEGKSVPPLVCMAWYKRDQEGKIFKGIHSHVEEELPYHIEGMLDLCLDNGYVLLNQSLAFDACVLSAQYPFLIEKFFAVYEKHLAEDTEINEKMIDNARGLLKIKLHKKGSYTLATLAKKYLNVELDKTTWRQGYEQFLNVPISEYPEGAKQYPIDDVVNTVGVYDKQMEFVAEDGFDEIPNSRFQVKADFAFRLMSAWGIRTEKSRVFTFEKDLKIDFEKAKQTATEKGFIRPNGTKNMKVIKEFIAKKVDDPKMTLKGNISTDAEALEEAGIKELSDYNHIQKLLTTYIPVLKKGVNHPINAGYRVLMETGRASCAKPNLMNLPRKSAARECFIPRDNYVFCSVDYDTLELRTLAQSCIWMVGFSKLGEALNAGLDPHLQLAATLLGISYEEALDKKEKDDEEVGHYRQLCKVANFGYPGGLGAEKFVKYAAGQDVIVTQDEALNLKKLWLNQWPEMQQYFKVINNLIGPGGLGDVVLFNNFVRGRVSYTAACNFFFQALAAAGAKEALFRIQKQCYTNGNILSGSRTVCFIHDETICEHPLFTGDVHQRAYEQSRLMCKAMQEILPDVKVTASPALMPRWYKGAKAKFDKNGLLTIWEPENA